MDESNTPRRKKKSDKSFIITVLVIFGVLLLGSFIVVRTMRINYANTMFARSDYYGEVRFTKLDNCSDVKFYAGELAVFTNSKTGHKGLIRLDGKHITGAVYSSFGEVDNGWQNTIYIAYPVGEDYPKYVKISDNSVDIKQYQGGSGSSDRVLWNSGSKTLSLHDANGFVGDLTSEEVKLGDGLFAVTDGKNYGFVDEWLDLKIDLDYEYALDFSDGCAPVSEKGKWGYIDESGKEIVPAKYSSVGIFTVMGDDFAFPYRQGTVPVLRDGKMGVVDKKGKTVVDFEYEVILPGLNGSYIAKKDGEWGIISTGTVVEEEKVTYADADNDVRIKNGTYRIKTAGSSLNMRASASSTAEVLAKIPNNTRVEVVKSTIGWACIKYYNTEGWVSADFLEKVEEESTTIEETTDENS